MGVVFDEVVTQVETPPQAPQEQQQEGEGQASAQQKAYCWQQQQATFWRRKERLEAD